MTEIDNADAGYRYVMGRARGKDCRAASVLEDIGRHAATGNVPLEEEARRTLDELIYRRLDGRPAYTTSDVTRAASEVYERHLRQLASQAAAELGRRGRAVNSEAQQEAARVNGAKGGRPTRLAEYEERIGELLAIEDRDERACALHLAAKEIDGIAWNAERRAEAARLAATIRAQIPADADMLRGMDRLAARGALEVTSR